ncbi:MAG: hypothetical protein C9356_15725 [Oleiphilus sp.]|nr:MAG: hypothetical protein C9356_15725 [Oleiphilus sp.]
MPNSDKQRDWSQYASLEEMSVWSQEKKIRTFREWMAYPKSKMPEDFFFNPQLMPGFKEMGGWGGFLGTGRRRYGEEWASLEETIEYIKHLNATQLKENPITTMAAWVRYCQDPESEVPKRYPMRINLHYGKEYTKKGPFQKLMDIETLWNFEVCREYVRGKRFKGTKEFVLWASTDQRPSQCPRNPEAAYRDRGWINMRDFLGLDAACPEKLDRLVKMVKKDRKMHNLVTSLIGSKIDVTKLVDDFGVLCKDKSEFNDIFSAIGPIETRTLIHDLMSRVAD